MKYENFDTISTIVKQIKEHEEELKILECQSGVIIKHRSKGVTLEITTFANTTDASIIANKFISVLINDIKSKITGLKIQLDLL